MGYSPTVNCGYDQAKLYDAFVRRIREDGTDIALQRLAIEVVRLGMEQVEQVYGGVDGLRRAFAKKATRGGGKAKNPPTPSKRPAVLAALLGFGSKGCTYRELAMASGCALLKVRQHADALEVEGLARREKEPKGVSYRIFPTLRGAATVRRERELPTQEGTATKRAPEPEQDLSDVVARRVEGEYDFSEREAWMDEVDRIRSEPWGDDEARDRALDRIRERHGIPVAEFAAYLDSR